MTTEAASLAVDPSRDVPRVVAPPDDTRLVHLTAGVAVPFGAVRLMFGLERLGFCFWLLNNETVMVSGRCITPRAIAYVRFYEDAIRAVLLASNHLRVDQARVTWTAI
jgi:hypothetical protein